MVGIIRFTKKVFHNLKTKTNYKMSTFQETIIIGYLGNVPETKHFDGGGQLTSFSMATTEVYIDKATGQKKEVTEWHRIVLNGKLSELADKYLTKGSFILLKGKLRTRKWTDANSIEKYTTEIVGREMKFLSSKKDDNNSSAVDQYQQKNQQYESVTKQEEHDDLPF